MIHSFRELSTIVAFNDTSENVLNTKKQLLGQPTLGLKPSRTARQHWDASKCFGPGLGGNITDAAGIVNGIARLVLLD